MNWLADGDGWGSSRGVFNQHIDFEVKKQDSRLHGDDIEAARRLGVIPAKAGIHAFASRT